MLKKYALCLTVLCVLCGQVWGMEENDDTDMPGLIEKENPSKTSVKDRFLPGLTVTNIQFANLDLGKAKEMLREAGVKIEDFEKKEREQYTFSAKITGMAINGAYVGLERSVSKLVTNTIMLVWQGQWKRLPGLSWFCGKPSVENLNEAINSASNLRSFSTTEAKYKHLRALFLCDIEKISSLSSAEERKVFQVIIDSTKDFEDAALTSYLEEKYNQMVPTPKVPATFAAHEQKLRDAAQQQAAAQPQPDAQNLKEASSQAQQPA